MTDLWRDVLEETDTRFMAHRSIAPHKERIAEHVYRTIAVMQHKGMTCDEVERWTGLSHQTASARVNELWMAGRLQDSGLRRKTRSGRNAAVYVATR